MQKQLDLFKTTKKYSLKWMMYGRLCKVPNKKSWRQVIHPEWYEMLSTYKSKTKKTNME